jgi:hypothetical protein
MSKGPGVMQREILRRASARRNAFTVREMASKLFTELGETRIGTVRRALQGLVTMGYLKQVSRQYSRTSKPLSERREWTTPVDIVQIDWADADVLLHGNHYLGSAGYRPVFCLTTPTRDALALFGPPVASHFKMRLERPLELTRLWRTDDCPFPLSQFLARAVRWTKREAPETDCIFSYADPAAINPVTGRAHHGGVYVASGWTELGEARATDHWVTPDGGKVSAAQCYRRFKTKSVERIAAISPTWRHVAGRRKRLFVYPVRLSVAAVLDAISGRYARGPAAYGNAPGSGTGKR